MKKLLFSILLTMASAMAMNVSAGTRTIYLDANMWNTDGAIFAVHVWNTGDIDAQGYQLTHVEGSIYTAEIRDDATNAIFVRKDPNAEDATANVWNGTTSEIPPAAHRPAPLHGRFAQAAAYFLRMYDSSDS